MNDLYPQGENAPRDRNPKNLRIRRNRKGKGKGCVIVAAGMLLGVAALVHLLIGTILT